MLSTNLKVHKTSHCHQIRTEPQQQSISTENFVNFGHVVSVISYWHQSIVVFCVWQNGFDVKSAVIHYQSKQTTISISNGLADICTNILT